MKSKKAGNFNKKYEAKELGSKFSEAFAKALATLMQKDPDEAAVWLHFRLPAAVCKEARSLCA